MESMKLVLGAELALPATDPGPADPLVEVSLQWKNLLTKTGKIIWKQKSYLNDMALRSLPARSLSRSALMMFPVDLFKSLEDFKSRLASA